MTSYAHKKIAEAILSLDRVPDDAAAFDKWIRAGGHLDYLRANAKSDEFIIYTSGPL